ncbi:unnamed protein product [Pedinophyceae sp. YPF-701]|nr:unnamed protein product [Pedinophyceae sp. YPF-701]
MGKGGDSSGGRANGSAATAPQESFFGDLKKGVRGVKQDLEVLKNIWFKSLKADVDHAARLEGFYSGQAAQYDKFREHFLWGRRPMLAATAARLRETGRKDLVWVDLGGGTGRNVEMMADYIDLKHFKKIYVVDLCGSLCRQAEEKVAAHKWRNVEVVEADACTFKPAVKADLVTFSYSLTMIPPFLSAVDNAIDMMADDAILGVADFFVSGKYDSPLRRMSWIRRFFWRATFDTDNIDIGPERRAYLEHRLQRVMEVNSQGSIPYVPYLRAPWYVWVGQKGKPGVDVDLENELHHEAPPRFPPTFLYTQSWEDPRPDMEVLKINSDDVVLTLTSGGCNALNLCLQGAREVVTVDCNPAQSALVEIKKAAIEHGSYEDAWKLFGEGKHEDIERLYERELAPWLSENSLKFWNSRLHYFRGGLYYQGGMGMVVWAMAVLCRIFFLTKTLDKFVHAPTLEEQRKVWLGCWAVRLFLHAPAFLKWILSSLCGILFLNRFVMWFGGGVPLKQLELIEKDGVHITEYVGRTFHSAAMNTHVRNDNYFYYNCLTGRFSKECCPSFLTQHGFQELKNGKIKNLTVANNFFVPELAKRKYSKVIMMDHADWLPVESCEELAQTLGKQVVKGGVVIWRSASYEPPYAKLVEKAGFKVKCISRADKVDCMDRVNMYASFWSATKL